MAEYIERIGSNEALWVGTCSTMKMIRRDEMEAYYAVDKNPANWRWLLNNSSMWRFPYPVEDIKGELNAQNVWEAVRTRSEGRQPYAPEFRLPDDVDLGFEHKEVVQSLRGAPCQANVFFACPRTFPTSGEVRYNKTYNLIGIVGQAWDPEHGEFTVVKCGYCGAYAAIEPELIEAVRTAAPECIRDRIIPMTKGAK